MEGSGEHRRSSGWTNMQTGRCGWEGRLDV